MRQRRLITLAAPVLIGSLALAACGEKKEEGGTGSADKVVKIGFISPLSGDLSALGLGMRNSVDLAIKQANAAKKIPGWKIELAAEDDTAKPEVGQSAATKLSSDPLVVGVVGTLNSSVAQQVQPILDGKNIVMISPANTNPTLTQGEGATKSRPYKTYFRVATTDAIQGPFAARYVSGTLKFTKVAIVHDKKTYGQGLQAAFAEEFKKQGGQITITETVAENDKDFSAVIGKIKPTGPQLVYYGGEYPAASLLSKQMKQKGLNVPLMGGDGIYDPTFIKNAGAQAENDLATSVGAPTESLDSAKGFIDAYAAGGYGGDAYGAYGAQSYDAANTIINALAKVLAGKDKIDDAVRTALIQEVQNTSFEGATGKVAFDEFGDTTTKILTVYKVSGGAWKPEKTDTFQ